MITPVPKLISAWAIVPSGFGVANSCSNPKACWSQSIAPAASR
jgi:hypothetical protein